MAKNTSNVEAAETANRNGWKIGKPPKLRVVPAAPKERESAPKWSKSERQYFTDLHRIVDEVYSLAADKYGWTWSQLAVNAELCYSTVGKLGDRETRWPRFSTVYKLCKSVGIDLVMAQPKQTKKPAALKVG